MNIFFVFLLMTFVFSSAFGEVSARRNPQETYEEARFRNLLAHNLREGALRRDVRGDVVKPEHIKTTIDQLQIHDVPEIATMTDLIREFQFVRDERFFKNKPLSAGRRLSWLYPDDGCYTRAEVAKIELRNHGVIEPKKIFAFGDLLAKSDNSLSGHVQWWYHVAVTYRQGNQVYVLDPAIEPERPMTLEEWDEAIGGTQSVVKYAICSKDTFDPTNDCISPKINSESDTRNKQKKFFPLEWNRLVKLKRDPVKELGDFPPWLKDGER